jgi:glycosyltransferase involved in cell wall biosynthesis
MLCVSAMESWGGGELFLLNLIKGCKDFDFVIASPAGKAYDKFNDANIKLVKINSLRKIFRKSDQWSFKDKLRIFFNIKFSSIKLFRAILKNKPELIVANGNFAALYAYFAAKLTGRKMIIIQHLLYKKNSLDAKALAFMGKRVQKLVCVSNAVANRTNEILQASDIDKIIVIHNGVALPKKFSVRSNHDNINLGFVGSIIRTKGLDMILQAITPVLLENKNVFMHIFGTKLNNSDSQDYYDEIHSAIKDTELENKVVFHGHLDSMDEIYNSIDILINFSAVEESFGYNILEAMSYSKLVFGADAGGIPELIENKKSGFLVEQNNVKQLSKSINYCIDNFYSEELINIRKDARKTAMENFSLENFHINYKNLFNSILQEK